MVADGIVSRKLSFVTIGATASFDGLIKAVLSRPFLRALREANYTDLLLQHGNEGEKILQEYVHSNDEHHGINIRGFKFNQKGLGQEMRAAKGERGYAEGVVISHAGSGSILDGLRLRVPLIVVPNPHLLDNHQEELAEELARQGYVIHGKLEDLSTAIEEAETFRAEQNAWPPPIDRTVDPEGRGLVGVMDDEMGFVD